MSVVSRPKSVPLLATVFLSVWLVADSGFGMTANEASALKGSIKAVKRQLGSPDPLAHLQKNMAHAPDDGLRETLAYSVALGLLYTGQNDALEMYQLRLEMRYADSMHATVLDPASWSAPCEACKGSGKRLFKCLKCEGTGKCPNAKCKNGEISYRGLGTQGTVTRECPVCNGSQQCPECHGKGFRTIGRCRHCGGNGQIPSKAKLRELYVAMLDRCLSLLNGAQPKPPFTAQAAPEQKQKPESGEQLPELAGGALPTAGDLPMLDDLFSDGGGAGDDGKTPEHLKGLVGEFGNWLVVQQRRIGAKIVNKIRAEQDGKKAVLHMGMHKNFFTQDYGWQKQVGEAFCKFWGEKCMVYEVDGRQLVPATMLEDDKGNVIGKSEGADGRLWLKR